MNTKTIIAVLCAAALISFGACGSKQPELSSTEKELASMSEGVDPVDALVGDAPPIEDDSDNPESPSNYNDGASAANDEDKIGGTNGALLAVVKVSGEEVKATFTVKEATNAGNVVKSDVKTGKDCSLPPGEYDIVFTTKAVAGNATKTLQGVKIPQGIRIRREVKFPTGQITLVTGGRCAKKAIKIKEKGATEWMPGKYTTCKPINLMAGEYEAEVVAGKIPISGIQVYDGGIRDILIRKQ